MKDIILHLRGGDAVKKAMYPGSNKGKGSNEDLRSTMLKRERIMQQAGIVIQFNFNIQILKRARCNF